MNGDDRRPLTLDDVLAVRYVAAAQIRPDGAAVAFVHRTAVQVEERHRPPLRGDYRNGFRVGHIGRAGNLEPVPCGHPPA